MVEGKHFSPLSNLKSPGSTNIALIILNQHLPQPLLFHLWSVSKFRVCADGGANRLFDASGVSLRSTYIPDRIVGDLDSISQEALQFYKSKGVKIIQDKDVNHTDFSKSLNILPDGLEAVYALADFGGRFDHMLGNINCLYEWQISHRNSMTIPLYLLSESSVIFLLDAGVNTIDAKTGLEDGYCGFAPVSQPANCVTTNGFKWNVKDQPLKFGSLISTSNKLDGSPILNIVTDTPLLFTLSFKFTIHSS